MTSLNTPAALTGFFARAFPGTAAASPFVFESVAPDGAVRVRLRFSERVLRPGGTISGPWQMTLVDTAMYAALLAHSGLEVAPSATANLTIHFLRRPPPADLVAEARLLRVGRRLAVGEVVLTSAADPHASGPPEPVGQATVTYAVTRDPTLRTTPQETP